MNTHQPLRSHAGFSLVELVVTVAVVGITAAIAIPNFIDWRDRQQLKNAATEVANVMFSARARAIRERKNFTLAVNYTGNTYTLTPAGGSAEPRLDKPWGNVELLADGSDPLCPPLSGDNVVFRPNSTTDNVGYEGVYLRSQSSSITARYRIKVLGATGKIAMERWQGGSWSSVF